VTCDFFKGGQVGEGEWWSTGGLETLAVGGEFGELNLIPDLEFR
jgi:hypothetical protein